MSPLSDLPEVRRSNRLSSLVMARPVCLQLLRSSFSGCELQADSHQISTLLAVNGAAWRSFCGSLRLWIWQRGTAWILQLQEHLYTLRQGEPIERSAKQSSL